jgi:hypothetical protein
MLDTYIHTYTLATLDRGRESLTVSLAIRAASTSVTDLEDQFDVAFGACASTANLPRLHAISYRPVRNSNPLVPTPSNNNNSSSSNQAHIEATPWHAQHDLQLLRREVVTLLAQAIAPSIESLDASFQQHSHFAEMAANYMLLNLISKVTRRQDAMCIGKFAVNLIGATPAMVARIATLIPLLLPKSVYLPMLLQALNSIAMVPRKDYDNDQYVNQAPLACQ